MTRFSNKYLYHGLTILAAGVLAVGIGIASAFVSSHIVIAGIIFVLLVGVIFKNPLIGMYMLIFFLPFERIGSIDVAGATIRISQVIAMITIVVWFMRGLVLQKFKFRPNPIFLPIAAFLAINCIGLTNSENIERSLLVFGFTIFTIVVSLALPNIIRHKHQLHVVINVLLVSCGLVSLFGIYQFVGDLVGLPTSLTGLRPQYTKAILGFPRVQSTALEPLYFANYLLIPLGVAISLFLSRTSKIKPLWLLALLGIGGLNLVLTVSRGGYIAFAVLIGVLGIVLLKDVLRPRVIISAIICISIVGLAAFRFLNAGEQLTNFVEHVGNIFGGASYVERVETFEIANRIWDEHPLVGIGPGGFGPYASFHPLITPSEGYKIVNNEYIELLAETGILGLLAYITMVGIIIVRSVKAWRKGTDPYLRAVLVGLMAAYLGILVQYNTFSVLYIMHIWVLIGLIVCVQNLLLTPHAK